mgnify:CR=1 FL=1
MTDQENVANIMLNKPALDNLRALTLFAGATLFSILKNFNDEAEKGELTDDEKEQVALFINLFQFAEHIYPILIDASQALDEELESPTNQITVSKHLH